MTQSLQEKTKLTAKQKRLMVRNYLRAQQGHTYKSNAELAARFNQVWMGSGQEFEDMLEQAKAHGQTTDVIKNFVQYNFNSKFEAVFGD